MSEDFQCPYCANKFTSTPDRTWEYGGHNVKHLRCTHCGRGYNEYWRGGELKFVLPKPGPKKRRGYLNY